MKGEMLNERVGVKGMGGSDGRARRRRRASTDPSGRGTTRVP
jgi:hypothetical protein